LIRLKIREAAMPLSRAPFALLTIVCVLLSACAVSRPETPMRASMSFLPKQMEPAAVWDQLAGLPWPQDGQRTYNSYDDARRIFWRKLYPRGGTEFYCGVEFDAARKTPIDQSMSVEHVFPADAIAESEPGCTNRDCAAPKAQRAMADLNNLWPALARVNSSRSRLRFGVISGETSRRFTEFCPDFERTTGAKAIVEPRDGIKGDIARTLVYMHFVYGLALEDAVTDKGILLGWMQTDPPDAEEVRRNALIGQLQGTPNPLLLDAFLGF
jgi:deoxyribonuclease I